MPLCENVEFLLFKPQNLHLLKIANVFIKGEIVDIMGICSCSLDDVTIGNVVNDLSKHVFSSKFGMLSGRVRSDRRWARGQTSQRSDRLVNGGQTGQRLDRPLNGGLTDFVLFIGQKW